MSNQHYISKVKQRLEVGSEGLINFIENKMKETIEEGFANNEGLKYLEQPETIVDLNPDEANVTNLPAMFVWCKGFDVDRKSAGGQSGQKIRRALLFHCNYRYVLPEIETYESSKQMKKIGWHLFEYIDGDLDLGGAVNGVPNMKSLDLFPKWMPVGNEFQTVSNVNIRVEYMLQHKKAVSKYKRR